MKAKKKDGLNYLLIVVLLIGGILVWYLLSQTGILSQPNRSASTVEYMSEDLKISLRYPKGWYIDDRNYNILLTDYETSLNRNDQTRDDQIEIYISNFSRCFQAIQEDLMNPACGERKEGGPDAIVSEESEQLVGGVFYHFVTRTPQGSESVYYLLENDDRLLWIRKQPDPSQFEKEFEEIVNSIRFLN